MNHPITAILNTPEMQELRAETKAACDRTGKLIGTSVEQGRFRVEHIVPRGSKAADVIPLSERVALPDAVAFLKAL